jgi:hypothetical protein
MIASEVTLGVVSKTMPHSTLWGTVNVYGHLARHTAHQAVDAVACGSPVWARDGESANTKTAQVQEQAQSSAWPGW